MLPPSCGLMVTPASSSQKRRECRNWMEWEGGEARSGVHHFCSRFDKYGTPCLEAGTGSPTRGLYNIASAIGPFLAEPTSVPRHESADTHTKIYLTLPTIHLWGTRAGLAPLKSRGEDPSAPLFCILSPRPAAAQPEPKFSPCAHRTGSLSLRPQPSPHPSPNSHCPIPSQLPPVTSFHLFSQLPWRLI